MMIKINYVFKFPEDNLEPISFIVNIDQKSGLYIPQASPTNVIPPWTSLDFCQCENCPYSKNEKEYCPVALNLCNLIYSFQKIKSYTKTMIFIETENRSYAKKVSLQEGLFSLFGLIMATSDCDHFKFLRPLTKTHLPFATYEETIFRVSSFALLREFMLAKKESRPLTFELSDIQKNYDTIQKVNQGILNRIQKTVKADAQQNALVILNGFAQLFEMEFEMNFSTLNNMLMIE